jgi:CheY-like chemotaxis protein
MSAVLAEIGYGVRCAEDSSSALRELCREIPDILLSDLNMPGMSGFELLCLVRNRFPGIQTIAMSGMFSGDEVPPGVDADAFYQKGTRMESLLGIMRSLPLHGRVIAGSMTALIPVPIRHQPVQQQDEADPEQANRTIACLNCMRMIAMVQNQTVSQMRDIVCADCSRLIQSAFARSADHWSFLQSHTGQEAALPALNEPQQFDN